MGVLFMMARIDKYFIAELQERGYDFDFKKLCDIYRASRERPDYIKNKNKKNAENIAISKMAIELERLGLE